MTVPLQAPAGGSAPHVSEPVEGFYRMRLAKGGVFVAVRIWRGFGLQDGMEMSDGRDPDYPAGKRNPHIERGYHWRCLIDGVERHIWSAWPACAGEPISEAEYRFLLARREYATAHTPDDPFADPRQRVDFNHLRFDFRT